MFEQFGDEGADTLDRFFAQIEYTATWCVRMLDPVWRIRVVLPEAFEDVVVIRNGRFELRQVKTRDESVGAWSVSDLLPILAKQYAKSYAFGSRRFTFHFVSDGRADTRSPRGGLGPLERLKELLSLHHAAEVMDQAERAGFDWFLSRLPSLLAPQVQPPTGHACDDPTARGFLLNTFIETNDADFRSPRNVEALDDALRIALPAEPRRTVPELRDAYDRLLLLIVGRIRTGTHLSSRAIRARDVLACRVDSRRFPSDVLDLDRLPGKSTLEKKTLVAGFDSVEAKLFRRQLGHAKVRRRELAAMQLGNEVESLDLALTDLQRRERRRLSQIASVTDPFGPKLLEAIHATMSTEASKYLPAAANATTVFCQGLLWENTQRCFTAWHRVGVMPATQGSDGPISLDHRAIPTSVGASGALEPGPGGESGRELNLQDPSPRLGGAELQ